MNFGIEQLYFLNLIVTILLTAGTFYRIKIERESVRIAAENAIYRKTMKVLIENLKIEDLTQEEFKKLIEELFKNANNS